METATATQPSLLAEVDRIKAMADPVARNLAITQMYHDLEIAMGEVFDSPDLSWCAYGVWASRQVGDAMQGLPVEYVQGLLDDPDFVTGLALPPQQDRWARRVAPLARRMPDAALAMVLEQLQPNLAEALGQGNLRVFGELAPTFAGFVDLVRAHDGDLDAVEAGLPELYRQLDHATYEGGAGYELTLLCECYLRALRTDDAREKAQLIYYANLRGAHYEQQRVQGPLEDVTAMIVEMPASLVGQQWVARGVGGASRRVAPRTSHRLRYLTGTVVGALTTDIAVRVNTPIDDLDVGQPLEPGPSGQYYPEDLRDLELPEFEEFLRPPNDWMELGPQPAAEVRADNWIQYHERMPFIAHVMRMRQQTPEMRLPPFGTEAAEATGAVSEPDEVVDIDLRGDGVTDLREATRLR
ncbi:MAG: hypothetical protein OES57_15440 [Acidimicrobiia bacterium]|nr:hypothetical protein [Acidimicrobiia bacterium]